MKTFMAKAQEVDRKWYVIGVEGKFWVVRQVKLPNYFAARTSFFALILIQAICYCC